MANDGEREIFWTGDNGQEYCDEEYAIADLLNADVLFCNSLDYLCPLTGKNEGTTLVLFVLCNDVFAWGCADGENITTAEVPTFYKLWQQSRVWGPIKWACLKRNEQPQFPVARDMKAAGAWNEEMENLPPNQYDARCRKIAEEKAKP